jgi:hypothetical protein
MTPVVDGYQRAGRSDQLRMKCQNHSIPIKNVDGIGLPASLPNILPPRIVALPSTRSGGGLSVSRFPSVAAAVDLGAARARGFLAIKISWKLARVTGEVVQLHAIALKCGGVS